MGKRVGYPLLAAFILAGFCGVTSCSKKDATPSISISLSKDTALATGFDAVKVVAVDEKGNDISSSVQVYVNGATITGSTYYPAKAGTNVFTAKKGTLTSNEAKLVVAGKPTSDFTQKILLEDFTGTWCGYCPRVPYILKDFLPAYPNTIFVGVHGGGVDPFYYLYANKLVNSFKVTGFPYGLLNRASKWDEGDATLTDAMDAWAPVGLAIESAVGSNAITGKVKVKFGVNTDLPLRVVVMMVENNLIANQHNYYSDLGGDSLYGYSHINVLRQTSSSDVVNGDTIAVASQVKGGVFEKTFSFALTGTTGMGTSYTVVPANVKIVAFVQYDATNVAGRKGLLNAQVTTAGANKDFD
ncbi:Outer membrane protein Omp28 [Filimonas lacunae]|uniref:Outer membrane protein Omp28 n=1 Tax=Filimonas lacunae TaxID=477680 RepID=A0A173MJJ2_9BACT|nr:Omp28-related outer membrane protein [Filimonas lacunae]BAV07670.1 hypothetical protein FLA_3701 [Filimonas lacunae]SIT03300.1 Outer membrane protein Omp28 [Filimonas lacunae]